MSEENKNIKTGIKLMEIAAAFAGLAGRVQQANENGERIDPDALRQTVESIFEGKEPEINPIIEQDGPPA